MSEKLTDEQVREIWQDLETGKLDAWPHENELRMLIAEIRTSRARIELLEGALRGLLTRDEGEEYMSAEFGSFLCAYCGGPETAHHKDDCEWVKAKRLMGEGK